MLGRNKEQSKNRERVIKVGNGKNKCFRGKKDSGRERDEDGELMKRNKEMQRIET